MKANVAHLRHLVHSLLKHHKQSPGIKGYEAVMEKVDRTIGSDYLYKKIVLPIEKAMPTDSIGLRESMLDKLSESIGFESWKAFTLALEEKTDLILDSMIGSYYSYVRMNAVETVILRSPVRIFRDAGQYNMELKGPRNTFSGEIKSRDGCLFVLLQSANGKQIHHVYKIGKMQSPQVLQGIFSGVSSSFDPIGGRVVLTRTDEGFEDLKQAEITPGKRGISTEVQTILSYLNSFDQNNLSINLPTSYTTRDLKRNV